MTEAERKQFNFEIAERAAIREFDGGESRQEADRNARIEVVTDWQNRKRRTKDEETRKVASI